MLTLYNFRKIKIYRTNIHNFDIPSKKLARAIIAEQELMMNNQSRVANSSQISKKKLVFLGDQSVGQTAVIHRFINDTFDETQHPTVGIDFISKTIYHQDRALRLQLWDTAGQQRFRSLIPSYIRDSNVAILIYDVGSNKSNQQRLKKLIHLYIERQTYENIRSWNEEIKNNRGNDVLIALVANKIDLESSDKRFSQVHFRVVDKSQGENLAQELDMLYFEVSAKFGTNIQSMFLGIAEKLPGNEVSQIMSVSNRNVNTSGFVGTVTSFGKHGNFKEELADNKQQNGDKDNKKNQKILSSINEGNGGGGPSSSYQGYQQNPNGGLQLNNNSYGKKPNEDKQGCC